MCVRVAGARVRTVPINVAISGMTLLVVPASILPTVTTPGSKTLTERVTNVCMAVTISHATGTGSAAICGADAWPPLPWTTMVKVSADASTGPGRVETEPTAQRGV